MFGFAQTFLDSEGARGKACTGQIPAGAGCDSWAAVIALSKELDTRVSPRFGTGTPIDFPVGAPPNDLSEPLPTLELEPPAGHSATTKWRLDPARRRYDQGGAQQTQ